MDKSVATYKFSAKPAKKQPIKPPQVHTFTTTSSASAAPRRHTARTGAGRSSIRAEQLNDLENNADDGLHALHDEFMADAGATADSRSPADAAEHASGSQAAGCSAHADPGVAQFKYNTSSSKQQPPKSTAEQREAEARNWDSFHKTSSHMHLESLPAQLEIERTVIDALARELHAKCNMARCQRCGSGATETTQQAGEQAVVLSQTIEVLVVSFTGIIPIQVPVFSCNRCDGKLYNLHPAYAGCFPSAPVRGVNLWLRGTHKTPALWYTRSLLHHLLTLRQHLPRISSGGSAAAVLEHIQQQQAWDDRISPAHHTASLSKALNEYAKMQLHLADPAILGMKSEGLVDCCAVCRRGHQQFLQERGVLLCMHGLPVLTAAWDGSAGDEAHTAVQAAVAHAASNSQCSSAAAPSQPSADQQPQAPAAAAGASATGAAEPPHAPPAAAATAGGAAQPPQVPSSAASSSATADTVKGLAGSHLGRAVCRPVQQCALEKFIDNPLKFFEPYAAALVIHGVSIDGLMRVPHLAKAGTATTQQAEVPARQRVAPDQYTHSFSEFAAPPSQQRRKGANPCNDFNADKATGRKSDVYDINGIVSMLCRHGFVLAAVNMPVGERWAYAILLLHILMCVHNVWPFLVLYDINCRWGPAFKEFVSNVSGWHPALKAWALSIGLPLPPFHIKAHKAACAEKNCIQRIPAAGRGHGETTEVFNKFLGLCGMVLQYASPIIRELWLEVQMRAWRSKKEHDLPPLLVRMWLKASAQQAVFTEEQRKLAQRATDLGMEMPELLEMFKCPAAHQATSSSMEKPWRAEMAEVVLAVGALEAYNAPAHQVISAVLPYSLFLPPGLGNISEALRELKQRKAALEREHAESWSVGATKLKEGVAELCLYRVVSLQAALADLSAAFVFTNWLQQHIGSQRKQHRKLNGQLDSLRTKMGMQVQQLLDWQAQLRCHQSHLRSDNSLHAALAATGVGASAAGPTSSRAAAAQQLMGQLCDGLIPWATLGAADAGARGPLAQRMGLVAMEIRAAMHEQLLVCFEMRSLLVSYKDELAALDQAVAAANQQVHLCLQQQDNMAQLDNPSYEQQCQMQASYQQMQAAIGQRIMLLQHRTVVQQLLATAGTLFAPYLRGDQQRLSEQQLADLADHIIDQAAVEDGDEAAEAAAGAEDDAWAAELWDDTVVELAAHSNSAAPGAAAAAAAAGPAAAFAANYQAGQPTLWISDTQAVAPWEATPAMLAEYHALQTRFAAMSAGEQERCVPGSVLTYKHLASAFPAELVNDAVLNEALAMLQRVNAQQVREGRGVKVHIYSTFFMEKLWLNSQRAGQVDYAAVRRYTLPHALRAAGQHEASVLDCRYLIAPCHLPMHWVLVVADMHQRTFTYLDPLGHRREDIVAAMAAYVRMEALEKRGISLPTHTWQQLYPIPGVGIPCQTDGHSCGVYAMVFAQCLAAGFPLRACGISAATAMAARAHIACDLMQAAAAVAEQEHAEASRAGMHGRDAEDCMLVD